MNLPRVLIGLLVCVLACAGFVGIGRLYVDDYIDMYVESSKSTAERAGYGWVGCETSRTLFGMSARTVCLVEVEGKVVDIDHVRAE